LDTTVKLKIGYVVLKNGEPVKTGLQLSKTSKLYRHAGMARRVAAAPRFAGSMVVEAFIEVPGE
jgi:hypothetical protein